MTSAELTTLVQEELGNLADKITGANDYTNAISRAERETGFSMPVTSAFQILWMTNRVKRHILDILRTEAAYKVQYKQIHMEHRFKQLDKMIKEMDEEFKAALEEDIAEFAGAEAYEMFGHKVDAGFVTDKHGVDYTYDDDQEIIIAPNEDSAVT